LSACHLLDRLRGADPRGEAAHTVGTHWPKPGLELHGLSRLDRTIEPVGGTLAETASAL
jgi:hypothetical protein